MGVLVTAQLQATGSRVADTQAMGLEDYLEVVWPRANVHLGSGPDDEKFLTRPYGRVDRPKLKRMLLQRCIDSGVIFHIDRVRHRCSSTCELAYA
jgi:Lycopene cyclase protein